MNSKHTINGHLKEIVNKRAQIQDLEWEITLLKRCLRSNHADKCDQALLEKAIVCAESGLVVEVVEHDLTAQKPTF